MRLAQALTMVARMSYRAEPDAAERALDEVVAMGPEILTSMLAIALSLRAECRFAAGHPRAALAGARHPRAPRPPTAVHT